MSKTPDGREICYKFANGQSCDGRCNRVHCCQWKGCHCGKCSKDCDTAKRARWQ